MEGSDGGLRVAEADRKDWRAIAVIRAGGMFSAPTLMVGASLGLGLGLPGAAAATLAGFGLIVLYMCFVSMQAADTGQPTALLAAPALGASGARYVVALIVGVVTVGWFGVQTAVCGASLALMLADVVGLTVPVWVCSLGLGLLMLVTAVIGFDGLRWLSTVAAPVLAAVCLYGVAASLVSEGSLAGLLGYVPLPDGAIGFLAGVNMAIGLFAFAGFTAGDIARFARTRRDAVLSCVAGVLPAALVALVTAASLAIVVGEGDVAVLMNSIGLPAVGLVALVLSAWTVNASNVYSAGLGFAVMLGRGESGSKMTTLVSGLAGIALALAGILGAFQLFLSFLSAAAPALSGALIADYWLVRKGHPGNLIAEDGFSIPGMCALVGGFAVGLVTGGAFADIPALAFLSAPFFLGPVNSLAASVALYVLAWRLCGRALYPGSIAWRTPVRGACCEASAAAAVPAAVDATVPAATRVSAGCIPCVSDNPVNFDCESEAL